MARTVAIEIDIKGQKNVLKLTDAIKQTNKALKDTKKEIDGATSANERLAKQKTYDNLVKQLVQLKAELKGARTEQRNAIRDFEAAKTGADSYRALNAELVRARQQFKELSKAEREGAKGRDIIKNIQRLDTELKKIDGSIGQFQRNVGNYRGALGNLGKTIRQVFLGRSIVEGIRRITGFLGDVIERNKETDQSARELSNAFAKIGNVAEKIALTFIRTFGPALTFVLNGVGSLIEALSGVSITSNEALNSFNEQLKGVQELDSNLTPLAARYDELTAKTKLSKDEQKELRDITKQLSDEVPGAATAFNELGEAIGVNTEQVRGLIAREKELLELERERALREQESNRVKIAKQIKELTAALDGQNLTSTQAAFIEENRINLGDKLLDLRRQELDTDTEIARLKAINTQVTAELTKEEEKSEKAAKSKNKTLKEQQTEYEKLQNRVEEATKAIQEQLSRGITPTTEQTEELKQSTLELNAVNNELKAILDELTPKKEQDAKATENEAKATKDLSGEISKLNEQQQKALQQTGIANERLKALEEAQAALNALTGEEESAAQQVEQIRQNLANRLQQIDRQTLQNQETNLSLRIRALEGQKKFELAIFEGTAQEKKLLEQQFNTELANLQLQQVTTQEALLKQDVQNFKASEEAKTAKAKEENQKRIELVGQLIQGAQQVFQAFQQLAEAEAQQEIDRLNEKEATRTENLTRLQEQLQTASGLEAQFLQQQIQQEEGAAADIAKRKEEIAKQENIRKKEAAISNAIIGAALGVINAFQLPPPASFIAAAVVAATTAAQIATISAQKFAKGGLVDGPSHAQGGVKFAAGGRVVELEGGEAVINKKSTKMFAPMLSAMNVAGGGKKFAAGGMLPSLGAPNISTTTGIGTAIDAAQQVAAFERRTAALEKIVLKSQVQLNTRDLQEDNQDRQVILNTINNE